jgi:hypothetical protein
MAIHTEPEIISLAGTLAPAGAPLPEGFSKAFRKRYQVPADSP